MDVNFFVSVGRIAPRFCVLFTDDFRRSVSVVVAS